MFQRAHAGRERMFGRFIRVLFLGIAALYLTLCLTPSAFAAAKGLYYNGLAYEFESQNYTQWPDFSITVRYWSTQDNDWDIKWTQDWGSQPIVGSLGACVFNGLLYCFFTTTDGRLQYITVDPGTQQKTGPTTVATGVSPHGAAAAVYGDTIYMITVDHRFKSNDGKQFAVWPPPSHNDLPATSILDAVAFYPMGNEPAGIMVVYNGLGDPPDLEAAMFFPPDNQWYSGGTLPGPPVNPYLWAPVQQGNLVLGTGAAYPSPGTKAPCVQFYGMTASGQDG